MRYGDCPAGLRTRPFTRTEANAAGIGDSMLQDGPWRQVFRGVWVHASLPDTRELRLAAAKLVVPSRAVACGLTAAWLYGADVRRVDDLDVHVSFPKAQRIRPRPGLVVSQETLAPGDVWTSGDLAVTSPIRTAFDCLRLLRGSERLVVADALTALRRTSVDELRRYFAGQRRLRNLRVGEQLLDDIEPRSESAMETRTRVLLVSSGMPRPVAQFDLTDAAGRFVARLDLAYPELKIAIEYDGAWHWRQRREDDRRRDAVRALGWIVLVFSADDIFGDPDRVVNDVWAARRRAAARTAG
jgi:hypothetical protein